jgi:hypothetical protein
MSVYLAEFGDFCGAVCEGCHPAGKNRVLQPVDKRKMKNNTLRRSALLTVFALLTFALGACTPATETNKPAALNTAPSPATSPAASSANSPIATATKVDSMVGKWNGPEGTYLNIAKKGDKYSIEIANLDGPKTYEGTAKGDTIEFTRDGKTETVKTATGVETGMKGFEKETNCLVVKKGEEGFCKKAETAPAASPTASPKAK